MRLIKWANARWTPNIERIIAVVAIAVSVCSGVFAFNQLKKDVVIDDIGTMKIYNTMNSVTDQVMVKCGIEINNNHTNYAFIDQNTGTSIVDSVKAVPVTVKVDGYEVSFNTYKKTVGELLQSRNIYLGPVDRLDGVALDDEIEANMVIKVVRVEEKIEYELLPIAYDVVKKGNDEMDKGIEKVIKEGKEGVREKSYKVIYEDNVEVSRELIADKVLENPIDKVIEYGTVTHYNTARGGPIRYTKVFYNMKATAYTSSFEDTGKHPGDPYFGITYTGIKAQRGIIAVDPNVIPLGTRVYVEVRGKFPDYGFALCADTGGAIKGNIIDVYLDDQQEVYDWGIKYVNVYILAD